MTSSRVWLLGLVVLSVAPSAAGAGELEGHQVFLQDVGWAPDAQHVVFSRYEGTGKYDPDNWAVWIADRDSSHARIVLRGALWASYSPDGRRLVAQKRIDGDWEIVTVGADGGDLRRLTVRPGDDDVPSWTPDGKAIVYTSEVDGNRDVWMISAEGGSLRRLTTDAASDYNPVASRDGESIVFYREKGDDHDQVWLLDLPSGREARVTDGSGHNFFPAFLPAGGLAWSGAKDGGERRLWVEDPEGGAPVALGPPGINVARWSSDGKEVLFIGGWPGTQVMRMAADGSGATSLLDAAKLETPPVFSGYPAVSPDGRRIAFLSNREGVTDVYVMNADGSHQARLTSTAEEEARPQWAADGREIWFAVSSGDSSRLYAVAPEGGPVRPLGRVPGRSAVLDRDGQRVLYSRGSWTSVTLLAGGLDGSDERVLARDAPVLWNVRWSSDGRRIAYTGADPDPKVKNLHVFVMNADGAGARQLTHLPAAEGRAQVPDWSPDGRRIALQASGTSGKPHAAHLWVVDAATGAGSKLGTHDEAYVDECPAWFPDGRRLAFQSDRTGRMEVWTVNADGSEPRQVTGTR